MRTSRRILLFIGVALLVAALTGYVATRDGTRPGGRSRGGQTGSGRYSPVDTRPCRAAQELAALATTPEEGRFAREAIRRRASCG